MKLSIIFMALALLTSAHAHRRSHHHYHYRGHYQYDYRECVKIADKAFQRSWDDSRSLLEATKRCRNIEDVDILKYTFKIYDRKNSDKDAIVKALRDCAGYRMHGKMQLLKFAVDKYSRGFEKEEDVRRALKAIKQTRGPVHDTLRCFKEHFKVHRREVGDQKRAMDLTAKSCEYVGRR